jgi:hypothetical protein
MAEYWHSDTRSWSHLPPDPRQCGCGKPLFYKITGFWSGWRCPDHLKEVQGGVVE